MNSSCLAPLSARRVSGLVGALVGLAALLPAAPAAPSAPAGGDDRRILFSYEARIGPIPAGEGPVEIFIPLPREDENQDVLSRNIQSRLPGLVGREREQGNIFWHARLERSDGEPLRVLVESVVRRVPFRVERLDEPLPRGLSRDERRRLARELQADARVVVGDPVLEPIRASIRRDRHPRGAAAWARAIYDWTVDNMEYKKIGEGWGNGDTFWACSQRYGNCTDFHSLFISLARTEGIPARFEMGFPVPENREGGEIAGYHCWTQFYLSGVGWVPVDASEAFKHPERRETFYGGQPADRILFTIGRDLELGEGHRSGPLNYFIYPHVEVGGAVFTGPMELRFSYQELGEDLQPPGHGGPAGP